MSDRVILHCDLNCFFASVELLSHPDLRDIPTAVCGDPASRHGIILAKNEPAKRLGIQTAETIWQAKKKCPGLVLLPPHHGLYREYSRRVNAIYEQYTDLVEPFGIDESWLDITGSMHLFGGDPKAIADALRRRLRQELGLTISVGGRAAGRVLHQYGVETIGQLAACSPQMLETLLGKLGLQLHEYANGLDGSPVRPAGQQEPVKSVGNGTTFPKNLTRWEEVQRGLAVLSDSVAMRLRQQGLYCGGVSVSLRNAQFRTVSRQMRLPAPTHLMKDIWQSAMELTRRLWKAPEPVRMLTVTALYITDSADSFQQLDLLEAPVVSRQQEKQEKLERTMDAIRGKYGRGSISFGLPGEDRAGWDD